MKRGMSVLLLVPLLGLLLSCTSSQAPEKAGTEKTVAPTDYETMSKAAKTRSTQRAPDAAAKTAGKGPPLAKNSINEGSSGAGMTADGSSITKVPAAEAEGAAKTTPENNDIKSVRKKSWQNFLKALPTAAYTFNPPSPITVNTPKPIYLWVDTTVTHEALAEEMKHFVPGDASQVRSGLTKVSPVMEASLTGPGEEFIAIQPATPQRQELNLDGRTSWKWTINPKKPGTYTLDIQLFVVPPPDLATAPHEIRPSPALHHAIQVEVTLWWLFDHFFDKYWKWLLGGLGTLLVTILGWWWQKRSSKRRKATR